MKRFFAVTIALTLCITSLTCCGTSENSSTEASSIIPETTLPPTLEEMDSAEDILTYIGYDMTAIPEKAEDISYSAFQMEDLTVAEMRFSIGGIKWQYHIAAVDTTNLHGTIPDVSGNETTYVTESDLMVSRCEAKACYNPGGEGQIIWVDPLTGLAYSLYTEAKANEWFMNTTAEALYVPG